MKSKQSIQGFILIIVLGLLGVMLLLAVNLMTSATSHLLVAQTAFYKSKANMIARSGIEVAIQQTVDTAKIYSGETTSSGAVGAGTFVAGGDAYEMSWRDVNGAIDLNDGIAAGLAELGVSYDASQVDPWPGDVLNISGLINLRLRRLLNAYGDAHKFVAQLGLPVADRVAMASDSGSFGSPFLFTSTDAGDRGASMPGDSLSSGLGDRILFNRPPQGYVLVGDISEIVNVWASEFLPTQYLAGGTFYEKIKDDFVLDVEPDLCLRLYEEFGIYRSQPTVATFEPRYLDTDPPDFSHLGRLHEFSPINLNAASLFVRAAVFYAPCNVSYLAESSQVHSPKKITDPQEYIPEAWVRPSIGVAGACFDPMRMTENGYPANPVVDAAVANVQRNRLMSLRDALILALRYGSHLSAGAAIRDFRELKVFLQEHQTEAPDNERALITDYDPKTGYFPADYLTRTLPNIFNPITRIPGYLGAPKGMLSSMYPLVGPLAISELAQAPYDTLYPSTGTPRQTLDALIGTYPYRRAEDFVWRFQLPKVNFINSGQFAIRSQGSLVNDQGREVAKSSIRCSLHSHNVKKIRTQRDFVTLTDTALTNPTIKLGPNSTGTSPDRLLGMIGLRDRKDEWIAGMEPQIKMYFDESLEPELGAARPALADADPEIGLVGADAENLRGSALEGPNKPFLGKGSGGSDLSPFGGVFLSSMGHGPWAQGQFNDSLYWRLLQVSKKLIDPNYDEGTPTSIDEEPPVPYPAPGTPFDQGTYDALQASPGPGKTWKRFIEYGPAEIWQGAGPNGEPDLDIDGWAFAPGFYPGPGKSVAEYTWAYLTGYNFDLSSVGDSAEGYFNFHDPDDSIPAGGMPGRVVNVGESSVNWKPIGKAFNQGYMIFWFRMPTGYIPYTPAEIDGTPGQAGLCNEIQESSNGIVAARRPRPAYHLLTLNLWERSKFNGGHQSYPVQLTVGIKPPQTLFSRISNSLDGQSWRVFTNSMPTQSATLDSSLRYQDDLMRPITSGINNYLNEGYGNWRDNTKMRRSNEFSQRFIPVGNGYTLDDLYAGTWHRMLVMWDLRHNQDLGWGLPTDNIHCIGMYHRTRSLSPNFSRWSFGSTVDPLSYKRYAVDLWDSNSVLSLGESHARWSNWQGSASEGDYRPTFIDPSLTATPKSYFPAFRLNSCLDNVLIHFGTHPLSYHPMNVAGNLISESRYDYSDTPSWACNPNLVSSIGKKLLGFGVTSYRETSASDNYKLEVSDGGSVIAPVLANSTGNFKLYDHAMLTPETRCFVRFTESTNLNGTYILEVTLITEPSHRNRLSGWEQE